MVEYHDYCLYEDIQKLKKIESLYNPSVKGDETTNIRQEVFNLNFI
jgi:hypothetical protein